MAVYDLEEQDKIDDLKAWWQRWGTTLTLALAAISIAFAGVQGWRWWQAKQAEEAAVLYAAVAQSVRSNDLTKAKDAAASLASSYAGTGYAPRAALILARMQFDAGDTAATKAQLQWVIDRSNETELKEIARYRMAEVLLNDKQYDEALKVLDAKHGDAFAALYADLRGDALVAAGRDAEARTAYQVALTKFDAKSQYRGYVQVKLDALGAVPAPAAGSATVPAAVAPPSSSAPAAAKQ